MRAHSHKQPALVATTEYLRGSVTRALTPWSSNQKSIMLTVTPLCLLRGGWGGALRNIRDRSEKPFSSGLVLGRRILEGLFRGWSKSQHTSRFPILFQTTYVKFHLQTRVFSLFLQTWLILGYIWGCWTFLGSNVSLNGLFRGYKNLAPFAPPCHYFI